MERITVMKRTLSIIMSLIIAASCSNPVFAIRNEVRRTQEQTESRNTVEEKKPELPAGLREKLQGYIVLKVGSGVRYENGEIIQGDANTIIDNDIIFIPAAATAKFFGKKVEWNEEEHSVSIDGTVIYPSDYSKLIDGRTLIETQKLIEYIGAKIVYSSKETVILGEKEMSQEVINEVTDALRDTFYVIPDKNAKGDGSIDAPFGGLEAAVAEIRNFTKSGMTNNITVYLREGLYMLGDEIKFTSADSGKNGYTITYSAYPNETVEVACGEKITNWQPYENGIYKAKIDTPPSSVCILNENGEFGIKARYPNLGEKNPYYYEMRIDHPEQDSAYKFYYKDSDNIPYLKDISNLQCTFFAAGYTSQLINCSINYREKSITLANKAGAYSPIAEDRYFLQGSLELLDSPGEFYYDKNDRMIYYMPRNNDIKNSVITYGTGLHILNFTGTEKNAVKNISFKNMIFGVCNMTETFDENYRQGIIHGEFVDNITFENNEIRGGGGTGFYIMNPSNFKIIGNYIHDVAANGIAIIADELNGVQKKYVNNAITNNYIYNIGTVRRSSSSISMTNVDNSSITYNRIDKSPRAGITLGNNVAINHNFGKIINGVTITEDNAYDYLNGSGNYVAFNDISNCLEDTQDGGPVYLWGTGKGNVVENNHVHDSQSLYGASYALYGDDSSGYTTWSKNLVNNVNNNATGKLNAAHVTKSIGHVVENNFYLNMPTAQCAYSTETKYTDSHKDLTYTKNLTMDSSDYIHGQYKWYDDRFKLCDYNFYYNDSGKYLIYNNEKAKNFDEWKKIVTDNGYMDHNSISGQNPNFVDYQNEDFRLRYDSPVYSLGIEDINERDIGVKSDFKFADPEDEIKKLYLETNTDGLSANIRLNSGETTQISPSARTIKGYFANLKNAQITYKSSATEVASVDENGKITAGANGIAEITATAVKNEKTVSATLFVLVNDNIESVSAKLAQTTLDINTQTDLICSAKSTMGYYIPISKYSYKSSNSAIAEVSDDGKVMAKGAGKATITVSAAFKGITRSASVEITVLNGVLKTVNIVSEKIDPVVIGDKIKLGFEAILSTGVKVEPSEVKVSYESGDESIITIDENGIMTALAEGRTNATVYVEKDGLRKSNTIAVAVFDKYEGKLGEGFKEINFGTSHGYADFLDDGKIKIRCTGDNFWGTADDGYYLYKEVKNPKSIEMTIESIYKMSSNTSVGITMRASAKPESRNVAVRCTPSGGIIMVWRDEDGGEYNYAGSPNNKFPVKIKLEKDGNNINVYADKGIGYELLRTFSMDLGSDITVGVPVFAQSSNGLSTETVISDLIIK